MVFKGRFFSSKKSSDSSSSPDTSSPKTPTLDSPKSRSGSDKKPKPANSSPSSSLSIREAVKQQLHSGKNKDSKSKDKEKVSKDVAATAPPKVRLAASGSATMSPIMASSLGLNRIKTRSGPLPLESGMVNRMSSLGNSKLGKESTSTSSNIGLVNKKKEAKLDKAAEKSGRQFSGGRGKAYTQSGEIGSSWRLSEAAKSNDASNLEAETAYDSCETPKESESPRFKAIMQATSGPRKKHPGDIKSFSHELNSKGVRPFPFWKPRGLFNSKEVLEVIRVKFEKAKEEVNSDLAVFAGDLIGIMEKHADTHPEWKETLEDLLLLARSCDVMSANDFWLQCEGIVQDLDDRRQDLPMGVLKKLHTRMLFILTRCTRLLQFHKESGFAEDGLVMDLRDLQSLDKKVNVAGLGGDGKESVVSRGSSESTSVSRKSYSQEQRISKWNKSQEIKPSSYLAQLDVESIKEVNDLPANRERIASWKPLPSPVGKTQEKPAAIKEVDHQSFSKEIASQMLNRKEYSEPDHIANNQPESTDSGDSDMRSCSTSKHVRNISWPCGDNSNISEDVPIMCRICEEYVPTLYVEDHLKVCAVADRCDQKGLNVDDRLLRIAETLEKMIEACTQKDTLNAVGSPDVMKVCNPSLTEESETNSPKLSDLSRRESADMLDCFQEPDNTIFDDMKNLPHMICRTRFGPKSDQGMASSSAGSMTPRSPIMTPRTNHIDMLLNGNGALVETEDLPQIVELADIARCISSTAIDDERSLSYLVSCLEDLQEVINRRKHEALTVQTFGTRIEKLHREKYLQLCDAVDVEKADATSTMMDEEDDVVRSLRTSPVHPIHKDRTSIDDFEILKPISRGAFGRVFLAKKRTTGDLFAIKVLKKADMIRKNAVESILAERDILISVRNPFVVRFFYSFTSRENLYLVMEYLNGGDLYSLLRNLGCLDEDVARVYIAELVLALEYLHSLRVVHRDLKPDNLLIAHDGHIKLTDFGLSKVGLINSTDDLSGPAVSGTSLLGEEEPQVTVSEKLNQREKRKRSAVGTPDYLAPEILLGTGHGASADWWSVGVILFEMIVGIPPFNAEHPQTIFDNILNRKIPWPRVPEEMSFEVYDLIDKLLTEDPNQRLGARGAPEVKQHEFFKNINWDTLARQKAAFIPSFDDALDTSYFTSRYNWNPSDEFINEASEYENSSDNDSLSGGSSCVSNRFEEQGDECGRLSEIESETSVNYSFSNFSFKNLSQLASINYDLLTKGWKEEAPSSQPHS